MKSRCVILSQRLLYIVLIICFVDHVLAREDRVEKDQADHLVPIESHIVAAYMELLSRTLFVSEANYARILVMPSTDEGEFAIAIYSQQTRDAGGDATVTCTRASSNLWYLLFQSQQANTEVPRVPVARTDAPIPKSVAVAVSKAIENMIAHRRPPDHSAEVLDGTDIRFSIERKGEATLEGLLGPYASGIRTQSLHRLTKLLADYCDSGQAERQQIAKEIERRATELVQGLENSEQKAR